MLSLLQIKPTQIASRIFRPLEMNFRRHLILNEISHFFFKHEVGLGCYFCFSQQIHVWGLLFP